MEEDIYHFLSHLRFEDRFVGPLTKRQFIALVAGSLLGAGLWYGDHAPVLPRALVSLSCPLASLVLFCTRVRGHGLLAWARLLAAHLSGARATAWAPARPPSPPEERAGPLPLLLAHMRRGAEREGVGRPPPAPTAPAPRSPRTQDLPCVPRRIADAIVEMPDGHRAAVLLCSGRNLALLSAVEQRALTADYHRFLRSLQHPVMILRRVRPARAGAYIGRRLAHARRLSQPMLKKLELYDIAYMESLAQARDGSGATSVATYIVVPAPDIVAAQVHEPRLIDLVRGRGPRGDTPTFVMAARALDERCAAIVAELNRIGIHTRRMDGPDLYRLWHESLCVRTASLHDLDGARLASALSPIAQVTLAHQAAPTLIV
jgi:hypothetical protein